MTKTDLEKLAFEHPNDIELGSVIRQILTTDNSSEDTEELSEWKENYKRLAADFDNFRKRNTKEKEDIALKVKLSMLESILDIDSDISIALSTIKDEQSRVGMNLILSKLDKFLTSHGVQSVQTDEYDSEAHEVVSMLSEDAKEISGVVSKGYSIGDKIIRFPKVILK